MDGIVEGDADITVADITAAADAITVGDGTLGDAGMVPAGAGMVPGGAGAMADACGLAE